MGQDFTTSFAISLKDETSGPAAKAAGALATLKSSIDGDVKALREMQSAMSRLKGGTTANSTAFAEMSARIASQKAKIASSQAAYIDLGGTFGDVKKTSNEATTSSAGFMEQLAGLRASAMALPAPVLAAASAWIAFAAAIVVGTAALLRYGVVSSDVRRTEQLRLEGLMTIRRWHGIAAGSVGELTAAIDQTAASSSIARSSVSAYAEQMYRAGLRGGTLRKALEAVSMTEAVQGTARAQRMAGMAISYARTGRSVDQLAAKIKGQLGGIAARQMLSLSVQSRKLEESIAFLTGGLKLEGFLGALNEITQLFSANTASGRALKAIFEALFNPLLEGVGGAGPLVKSFFQGAVIAALRLTLAIMNVQDWLSSTFRGSMFDGLDKAKLALHAGMFVVAAFAGVLIVTAEAAGLLALALTASALTALVIAAPFLLAAAAVAYLMAKAWDFGSWLAKQDWSSIGTSIVDGLVAGLTASRARVLGAVGRLAIDAKTAMADALGIHSPSRVFAGLGLQIPRGLAAGVEDGAPAAQSAVDGLLRVPEAVGAGGARSGGARTVSIGEVHVHALSGDARDLAATFRDELERLLEGISIEMGAPA